MLSDERLSRYVKFDKLEHKTLTQCDADADRNADANADDRGVYNSSTALRTDELKIDENGEGGQIDAK